MMQLGLYGVAGLMALMLGFSTIRCTADKNDDNAQTQTETDLAAVRNYIEENKPGKKWQTGPAQLDSAEIRKAYGKLRFYYVFSSPPAPPGAALEELVAEYQDKLKVYKEQFISLTVCIDEKETIIPLHKVEDYNLGLMRVKTYGDAKIAAAAILSLYSSELVSPGVVAANEVTVAPSENGWACSVLRENAFQGTVYFGGDGKLVSMTKMYAGAPPP